MAIRKISRDLDNHCALAFNFTLLLFFAKNSNFNSNVIVPTLYVGGIKNKYDDQRVMQRDLNIFTDFY